MWKFFAFFGINLVLASATGISLSFAMLSATGSTAFLGANLGAYYLPALLTPLAGWLTDRFSTRALFAVTTVLRALLLLVFASLARPHTVNPNVLLIISFCIGASKLPQGAIFRKAFTTLIGKGGYVRANSHYSVTANVSTLLGMGVGGPLVQLVGARSTVYGAAAGFLVLGALVNLLPNIPGAEKGITAYRLPVVLSVRWFGLQRLVALSLVSVAAVAPVEVLAPMFMTRNGFGANGQSAVMIALTVSGLSVGIIAGKTLRDAVVSQLAWWGVLGLLLCAAASWASFAGNMPALLLACAALGGAGSTALDASCYAIFHEAVPSEYQGRFFASVAGLETLTSVVAYVSLGTISEKFGFSRTGLLWFVLVGLLTALLGARARSTFRRRALSPEVT